MFFGIFRTALCLPPLYCPAKEEALAVNQPLFCWNQPVCAGSTLGCSSAPVPRAPPGESHQWACWQSNGISWTCSTVVVGPNALIQPHQTVPGRALPASVPPLMGTGRGQHWDDSLVISAWGRAPMGGPAARSPSSVFCICVPGLGLLYIRRSKLVKHLSNLGKVSLKSHFPSGLEEGT